MSPMLLSPLLALLAALSDRPADTRDAITLTNGKRIEGRIVQVHDEEFVYIREAGRREPVRQARDRIATVEPLVRERLAEWLDLRRPQDSAQDRWVLAQRARSMGLTAMARIQAYDALCEDPTIEAAHLFVGNRMRRDRWEWSLDTTGERSAKGKSVKYVDADEFEERFSDWSHPLVLESENYRLETNTSLRKAVNLLFDLERTYCGWMQHFGERLNAAELPWDPRQRMVVAVFKSSTAGYTQYFSRERLPYYSASTEQVIADSPNVVFTYFQRPADARPREFFDLALQQLLFTTMGLGHKKAAPPNTELNHWAHWIELGFSAWAAEHIDGAPGYATFPEPVPGVARKIPKSLAQTALMRARDNTLNVKRKELTNLVGMEYAKFYLYGEDGTIYRAKARAFVAYLMSENPPVLGRSDKPTGKHAAEGVFTYLREVFGGAKGHSSSALDDALGGRVDRLTPGWKQWLTQMAF